MAADAKRAAQRRREGAKKFGICPACLARAIVRGTTQCGACGTRPLAAKR